ncbi:MAG: hypothetical protein VX100_02550 [Pseudomonadota bacterium]|nr:hypothetical protein [Pseudomonadota bacterium]
MTIKEITTDYLNKYNHPSKEQIAAQVDKIKTYYEKLGKRPVHVSNNEVYSITDALNCRLEGDFSELKYDYVFYKMGKLCKSYQHAKNIESLLVEHDFRIADAAKDKSNCFDFFGEVTVRGILLEVPENLRSTAEEVEKVCQRIVTEQNKQAFDDYLTGLDSFVNSEVERREQIRIAQEKSKAMKELQREKLVAMKSNGLEVSLQDYVATFGGENIPKEEVKTLFGNGNDDAMATLGYEVKQVRVDGDRVRMYVFNKGAA